VQTRFFPLVSVVLSSVLLAAAQPASPPAPPLPPGAGPAPEPAAPPAPSPRSFAPRAQQTPQPPAPPAASTPTPPPPRQAQPTLLQLDVYQVETSLDRIVSADLSKLAREKTTRADLLAALGELGKARMTMRFDTTVDLKAETTLSSGRRLPVVQSYNISPNGKKTPSVTYQEVGTHLQISGNWGERDKGKTADVAIKFESSGVGTSGVEIDEGKGLPSFNTLSINQRLVLESGRPMLIMNNDAPEPGDEKGHTVVTILRILAERLDTAPSAQAHPAAEATAGPPALIHADIVEVTAKPGKVLKAMEIEEQLPEGTTLTEGMEILKKLGRVDVLSRPTLLVNWPQEAEVSVGQQIATPARPVSQHEDAPASKESYEQIGIHLRVHGRWLTEANPARAEITVNMRQRSFEEPPPVISPQGASLPSIVTRVWNRSVPVEAGRSIWITSEEAMSRGSNTGLNKAPRESLTLVRLTVERAS
jgi:hypothetical protein